MGGSCTVPPLRRPTGGKAFIRIRAVGIAITVDNPSAAIYDNYKNMIGGKKVKNLRRIGMILLAAMLLACFAACGNNTGEKQGEASTPEPEKATAAPTEAPTGEPTAEPAGEKTFELARVLTTTVTSGSDPKTMFEGMEYDERGLITFIIDGEGETFTREPVSYTFNEKGDPDGFTMNIRGSEIIASVENRYEAGALCEAVIKDVTVDGTPLSEGGDSALSAVRGSLTQPLRNYVGYENCTLRVEGIRSEIRYEEGRIVYALDDYPNMLQETVTEYLPDGSVRTKQNRLSMREGELALVSGMGTLTDAEGFLMEQTIAYPGTGEELIFRCRYEDSADPDTGAARRIAYYDEIILPDSMTANAEEGDFAELEQMKTIPIWIYTLDENGKIAKQEHSPEYKQWMGGGGAAETIWFENGRMVKQEYAAKTSTATVEYDYR